MSSTQSAPISRASHDVAGVDGEVLAQHRQRARRRGRRAGRRVSPPKNSTSVSTDRHAAPPASYGAGERGRVEVGGRAAPFDGERRLTSAMTATSPAAAAASSAARKPAGRRQRERPLDEVVERAVVGRCRRPVGGEDAVEVRAQLGRPLLPPTGMVMVITGGSAKRPPILPNMAAMASLPPWAARASPSV